MRKLFAFVFLPLLLPLSACDVSEMTTLAEISRPYAGVYVCEELTLGGKDMLPYFDSIELELGYDGTFTLSYATPFSDGEYSGGYEVSPDGDEIRLLVPSRGRDLPRTFSFEGGALAIEHNLGGRLLFAKFALP